MDHISAARFILNLICQQLFLYRSKITNIILPWFFTWQLTGGMFWIYGFSETRFFGALLHMPALPTILLWLFYSVPNYPPLIPLPILLSSPLPTYPHPNHRPHTFTLFIFPYPPSNFTFQLTLITHILST